MPGDSSLHLTFDRRLLRHPRAYHLRRMRQGLWLYLDLVARTPAGASSIELDPAVVAGEMGVAEGFVRSWLGHLKQAGYVEAKRLNGVIRVAVRRDHVAEPPEPAPARQRFFSATKLQRALGDNANLETYESVLRDHPDTVIRKALAGALAVPETQIRRSRTALFLFLLKRHTHAQT
jgi:hypothetical protein